MFNTCELCKNCLLGQTTCERYYHKKIVVCDDYQEGFDLDNPLNSAYVGKTGNTIFDDAVTGNPSEFNEEVRELDPNEILEVDVAENYLEEDETEEDDLEEETDVNGSEVDSDETKDDTGLNIGAEALYVFLIIICHGNILGLKTSVKFLILAFILHELGHLFAGLYFKCKINEVKFFLWEIFSYKASDNPEAPAWKRIRWSLGLIPVGCVTIFDSKDDESGGHRLSDLPMWQQLLITGAGIIVNLLVFAILYLCITFLPLGQQALLYVGTFARVSLILVALNLIPIYPFDGGAMLLQIIQKLIGKELSPQFLKNFSIAVFVLIVILYFAYMDWTSIIYSWTAVIL